MDGSRTTDENWKTLRRIVALLLALADLADRAGVRSPAVRSLVLWFLRPAEEIARDYVAGLTPSGQPLSPAFADDGAADAIRLAASFRALASALAVLTIDLLTAWQPVIAALCLSLAATGPLPPRRHPAAAIERRDSS